MNQSQQHNLPVFALWLRLSLSLFGIILFTVYWHYRGPWNFLWFTDIAFFLLIAAMWLSSSYLLSMAAISTFLFELAWNVDFFSKLILGGHLFGMDATAYMFDAENPTVIKSLSLVLHVVLPALTIFMLFRLGYHSQAWKAQLGVLSLLLPVCYLFSDPERNINWVFGIGGIQTLVPGWQYVVIEFISIALLVYLPSHMLLLKLFGNQKKVTM